MTPATGEVAVVSSRLRIANVVFLLLLTCMTPWQAAFSAGTPAGTVVENTAVVNFDLGGVPTTLNSNNVTFQVLERIDVVVTSQSGQVIVSPGMVDAALLFTVTNTGNGNESFDLSIDSALPGDDFDPVPAVPAIYFDTDASGDFSAGDTAYQPGINDPQLPADASVDVLLVNDIPGALTNGLFGRSELTATSSTGTGLPGETLTGLGDGGIDAVIGATGGQSAIYGEYFVSDVAVSVVKSVVATDPLGGNEPTVGATLTYTITVQVMNAGMATGSVISDPIPQYTTFVADSILLNGAGLTDAVDADVGELDTSGAPSVVVRLGDLTLADGAQTIEFQVTID